MCELDQAKGIDVGDIYINDLAPRRFAKHICAVEAENLLKDLKTAPYFSVISDGATDSAIEEKEIIIVRKAEKGVVMTKCVVLGDPESLSAEGIYNAIVAVRRKLV